MTHTEPPGGPQPGQAAWVPDPGGRHQYRWWDGRSYTDLVADGGVQGVDPLQPGVAAAPRPPLGSPPAEPAAPAGPSPWSQPPRWSPAADRGAAASRPAAGAEPVDEDRSGSRLGVLAVVAVAVLAIGAVVFLARDEVGDAIGGDGGGGGAGSFEGTVAAGELGAHDISVGATEVLLARVEPDDGVDVVVGVLVDGAAADRLESLYGEVAGRADAAEAFADADEAAVAELVGDRDRGVAVFRTDLGFGGDGESLLLVPGDAVDVTVVVAPFDGASGGYTIELQRFALDLDETAAGSAGGEELLRAVQRSTGTSTSAIDLAAELLELLDEVDDVADG